MKQLYIVTLIIVCLSYHAMGQQDPQLGLYMMNKSNLNPAAAGMDGGNVAVLYRAQWINMPGAPKTMGLVADMAIPNTNAGVGLNISNTTLGPLNYTRLSTNYGYKVNLDEGTSAIHLGLQAGVVQYNVDTKNLRTYDDITTDPTFNSSNLRKIVPDIGFGVFFRFKEFYAGATVPHLLQSKIKFINDKVTLGTSGDVRARFARIFRHYYFTTGGQVMVKYNLFFLPSVLVKYVANAPASVDLNANLLYDQKIWGGIGYRAGIGGALLFMAGVHFRSFNLGYAFEYTTGGVSSFSGTTHELMLNYKFDLGDTKQSSKKPYFLK